MANKYVQYAAGLGAVAAAEPVGNLVGDMYDVGKAAFNAEGGTISGALDAAWNAGSEGLDKAFSGFTDTLTSPQFLVSAGLGLAGIALGSGSSRPSLNFPALAGTSIVALNVANLLKSGKAAASTGAKITAGKVVGENLDFGLRKINPPSVPATKLARFTSMSEPSVLQYPNDLDSRKKLTLQIYKYQRYTFQDRSLTQRSPHTIINLPMPANLTETFNSIYSDVQLGAIGGELFTSFRAGFANQEMTTAAKLGDSVKLFKDALADESTGVGKLLARRLATAVLPDAFGSGLDMFMGNVPNPHLTVAFKGVQLRGFSYTWRFSPNNLKESQYLDAIITSLQAASLPARDGDLLLSFPDVVMPRISDDLIQYKPCVIDSVSVNYAPTGNPSFYKSMDGKKYPTEAEITIGLKELEIFTASDGKFESITKGSVGTDLNLNYDGSGDID